MQDITTDSIRVMGKGLAVIGISPSFKIKAGVWYIDRVRVKNYPMMALFDATGRLLGTRKGGVRDASIDASIVWPGETTGLVVHNTHFDGVSFRQAVLTDAHFADCRFTDCTFRSCDLSDGHFERCSFYDPDTQKSCDFSYAGLRSCKFEGCDLMTASCPKTRAFGIELRHLETAAGASRTRTWTPRCSGACWPRT